MRIFLKWLIRLLFVSLGVIINCATPSLALTSDIKLVESISGNKLSGKFSQPFGLYISEGKSRLYIADTGNNRLVSFDSELNFRTEFNAGGKLNHPISIVKNSKGKFFVIEGKKNGLIYIDIFKKVYKPVELIGVPKRANPVSPSRLAIDNNDNLYITDRGNGRILVLDPQGRYLKEIKFKNRPVYFSDVCLDQKGNIYALSTLDGIIYIFNKKGEIVSTFGKKGTGKGEFLFPTSLAVGQDGLIYVLDQHKGNVMVFKNNGKFMFSFSKKGQDAGELYLPTHIYIDRKDKIYIADRGNNRVQIFQNAKKQK